MKNALLPAASMLSVAAGPALAAKNRYFSTLPAPFKITDNGRYTVTTVQLPRGKWLGTGTVVSIDTTERSVKNDRAISVNGAPLGYGVVRIGRFPPGEETVDDTPVAALVTLIGTQTVVLECVLNHAPARLVTTGTFGTYLSAR